jgi:acyl-CoA ligase (AMP-forming) (exosortase A-associated)
MLLPELLLTAAARTPDAPALVTAEDALDYARLADLVMRVAGGLRQQGLQRDERVAVWLDKRTETVAACFGATAAGGVFVPLNPLLRATQVAHILRDSGAAVLVTSPERAALLAALWDTLPALRLRVLTGAPKRSPGSVPDDAAGADVLSWDALAEASPAAGPAGVDTDMAAILYTSGSTGGPKGVVLSHRNLVVGAASVASYLQNCADDTLLAVLPLSFDAGFSQLTTAFHAGARVVLLNYLLPRDVLKAIDTHRVTGLTAVPPLFIQLAQAPAEPAGGGKSGRTLRYFANTGGRMPQAILQALRERWPQAQPVLMYGLTEAFRSTWLPPAEVDRRPDSIGRAIPNAEVLVLREDGSECEPGEPGELVHRGPLVAQGYWNDPARTAARFRPLPARWGSSERVVYSGDTVRRDEEGYLYFIGRRDEMIKTSGYRVSPTEVEEVLYASGLIGECAVFGIEHPVLGQAIQVLATAPAGRDAPDLAALQAVCRAQLPAYMVPAGIAAVVAPLPRNANGKIDRRRLADEWQAES